MAISVRGIALLGMTALLTGCQTSGPGPTAEQVTATQDAQCQSFGHRKGSPGYADCRQTLYLQEERRREQAIAYVERLQANRPAPMQIDQSPPRPSLHCTSTMSAGVGQTNCY